MSLIRFGTSDRGPSAELWNGVVDWVHGSVGYGLGNRDFDDFAPYNAGNETVSGTTGAAVSLESLRAGVVGSTLLTADAGSNAEAAIVRHVKTELDAVDVAVFESRLVRNDSADAQMTLYGLSDQAGSAILASNVGAVSSNQDFLGFRWANDGTIDVISIVDGAAIATLINDLATVAMGSATGYMKLGLRIERISTTVYRLVPCVNGVIKRAFITNVASTAIPLVVMHPAIAIGTDTTTAPSLSRDWMFFADK